MDITIDTGRLDASSSKQDSSELDSIVSANDFSSDNSQITNNNLTFQKHSAQFSRNSTARNACISLRKSLKNTAKDPLVVGLKLLNELKFKESILKNQPSILFDYDTYIKKGF